MIIDSIDGSYLIHGWVSAMWDNIDGGGKKYLGDMMDDIQEELHRRGKQQTVNTYNNNTRYIRFKINERKGTMETMTHDVQSLQMMTNQLFKGQEHDNAPDLCVGSITNDDTKLPDTELEITSSDLYMNLYQTSNKEPIYKLQHSTTSNRESIKPRISQNRLEVPKTSIAMSPESEITDFDDHN